MSSLPERVIEAAFAPAAEAVASGRIPGAVLGIVGRHGARAVRSAGAAQIEPIREPHRPRRLRSTSPR